MENSEDIKRLFFALHIEAPWPLKLPKGRAIASHFRHTTIAFVGENSFSSIEKLLPTIPLPSFVLAPTGVFDRVTFLPIHFPRVVAWHIHWMEQEEEINAFAHQCNAWLQKHSLLQKKERPYLPHVTLCRKPFAKGEWKSAFRPLPLIATGFHLYESLGYSNYQSLWEKPFLLPFEEMPHTADLAFRIRGKTPSDLCLHGQLALCFTYPEITPTIMEFPKSQTLPEVVSQLNQWICTIDQTMGSPIKAVSYHGDIVEKNNLLEWEMIVDV